MFVFSSDKKIKWKTRKIIYKILEKRRFVFPKKQMDVRYNHYLYI